jgi:NTE family protein
MGKLRIKSGTKTTYEKLKSGINTLNATQNFSRISYSLNPFENGDYLQLNLVENKTKTFLKFGVHYDDLYKSALLVNLTQKKILFKNDVLSLDTALGDNIRYNLDYYIDNGFYWSFGFKSWFSTFNRNVANDFKNGQILNQLGVDKLNIDFYDFTNQAYLQTVFIQKYLIGAGIEYKHLKIQTKTIENGNSVFENSSYFNLFGHLKYDSFDNKYFPKSGWLLYGDFKTYLYSSNYTGDFNEFSVAKGEISFAQTFFNKITLKVQSEAGFKIGNDSVDFFNFVLGGYGYNTINNFKHFYGYDYLSVSANSFIKSNFTLDYEIFKKNHINFSANYANLQDGLFASGDWFSKPKLTGYAFGYGVESIVGPIEVKYSWSPELPKGYLWVSAGFWF